MPSGRQTWLAGKSQKALVRGFSAKKNSTVGFSHHFLWIFPSFPKKSCKKNIGTGK
jgi:hypothetical protein